MLKHRLREIKVLLGRVAPAASIIGQGIVWWTEIGGGDHDARPQAPLWVVHALDLKARAAALPVVEQRGAQRRRARPVPLAVQVAIAACATCHHMIGYLIRLDS